MKEPEGRASKRIQVLLVEDNDGDALLVQTMLQDASVHLDFRLERIRFLAALPDAVASLRPDVILLDLSLPDSDGTESFALVREHVGGVPVVIMTGLDAEEVDERTAALGAHGYIVKGEMSPGMLRRQIRHAIERGRNASLLAAAKDAATELATIDPLTGVANRLVLDDRLQRLVKQARRSWSRVGVLMLDLDRFKSLNDAFGHALGDEVLRCVAKRISQHVRESDTVARIGGDEFVILLADLVHETDAARVAQKVISAIRRPITVEGRRYATGASVGIATYPSDSDDPVNLLAAADTAMYHAKRTGAGHYRFYSDEMTAAAVGRLEVEHDLRYAVERDELRLHFQPLVAPETGAAVGFEALVRWQHPEHGLLSPDGFLPIAEETGLIVEIGGWVLREACRNLAAWRSSGHEDLRVSINVSLRQMRDVAFAEAVEAALREHGLPGSALAVEIEEGALLDDTGAVGQALSELSAMGVRVEIDDFGTGLLRLERLREVSVDAVKIDRKLIQAMADDDSDRMLVSGMVSLACAVGAKWIAEGVETPEQLSASRELGAELVQGFLFSPPVPPGEVEGVLRKAAQGWEKPS